MPERAAGLRFAVLGSVRAWRDEIEIDLGPTQQRQVLAILLVRSGARVGSAELIDCLWGDQAPASAANLIHRYVGDLRRLFEPALPMRAMGRWLVRTAGGYQLDLTDASSDLKLFRELGGRARRQAQLRPDEAIETYIEALQLWSGPCAEGLGNSTCATTTFAEVDHEYDTVLCEAAEAALRIDEVHRVYPMLYRAAARDALNEKLQAMLMLATAALGRQAEALQLYHSVRGRLSEELGVDPGNDLRAAYQAVLSQEISPSRRAGEGGTHPTGASRDREVTQSPERPYAEAFPPAHLPPDLPVFVGRQDEMAMMDGLLSRPGGVPFTPIITIDGMPGTGKTTLAIHWAHHVRGAFPDGQLYINLRGFDPNPPQVSTSEVLRGFLDAFGVPPSRVPDRLDALTGLYRSVMATKRVLILLDNARDAEAVRPLLPGASGSLVLITSRTQLTGILAGEGARPLSLDLPSVPEAREALVKRLGAERAAAEPEAIEAIIRLCARLPLAMAIVAARAAVRPHFSLTEIARGIADEEGALDTAAVADIGSAFSWSYRLLNPEAARLFRLLTLVPGRDISLRAIASLLGVRPKEARAPLSELLDSRLLAEPQPGRYASHDLIRSYGRSLSAQIDDDALRADALRRLLEHDLLSAYEAYLCLRPMQWFDPPPVSGAGVSPETFVDSAQAMAWFGAEFRVLGTAVLHAANNGMPTYAWRLALLLQPFYQHRGQWHDWSETMQVALHAARLDQSRVGEAHASRSLAGALYYLGHTEQSLQLLKRTRDLYAMLGLTADLAHVESNLGTVHNALGEHERAIEYFVGALAIHQSQRNRQSQARAIEGIGAANRAMGRYEQAIILAREAMQIFIETCNHNGEGSCWAVLSASFHDLRQFERAIECRKRALSIYRELNSTADEAHQLALLGDTYASAGKVDLADQAYREALTICADLHLPLCRMLRTKLEAPREGVSSVR